MSGFKSTILLVLFMSASLAHARPSSNAAIAQLLGTLTKEDAVALKLDGRTPDGVACNIFIDGKTGDHFSAEVAVESDGSSEANLYAEDGAVRTTVSSTRAEDNALEVRFAEHHPSGKTDWGMPFPGTKVGRAIRIEVTGKGTVGRVSVTAHHGIFGLGSTPTRTCVVLENLNDAN